jgi:serine/threonine-protein kinase
VSRLDAGPSDESVTSITQVDTAVGTLLYMAPEQLLSSSTATGSADVYALGAILYRAVSGEQVFGDADDAIAARRKLVGEAPPLSVPRIDRIAHGFAAVVARALKREPGQRFESAEQMQRALTELRDVAHALAFDLDAATEEAPPPSAMAPPPSIERTPPADEVTGEPTRVMSRPPMGDEAFQDEPTQQSPGPVSPHETPASETPSASTPSTNPRPTRPTVVSPVMKETNPLEQTLDEPPPASAPALAGLPRSISLRAAVLGLVAALALGTALGFGAHGCAAPRVEAATTP